MVTRLDELNILRSQPYKEYFAVMDLAPEASESRIRFSEAFESMLTTVMYTISVMLDYNAVNWEYIEDMIVDGYEEILEDFATPDDYTSEVVHTYAKEFVEATQNAIEGADLAYALSIDRAMYNAENEANTTLNYADYKDAIEQGYTKKTWHTEQDNRVRKTHVPLDGMTIPIFEYFKVGSSYMRYPKDESLFPNSGEIVNCRCTVTYGR